MNSFRVPRLLRPSDRVFQRAARAGDFDPDRSSVISPPGCGLICPTSTQGLVILPPRGLITALGVELNVVRPRLQILVIESKVGACVDIATIVTLGVPHRPHSHTRRVLRRWLLLRLLAGGLAATALVVVVLDLHLDLVVLAPATSDRSTTGGSGEVLPAPAVDAVAPTGDLGAVIAP